MRLKCSVLFDGMNPSEKLISINTNDGKKQVIVNDSFIDDDTIEVGYPVGYRNGFILVQLPQESIDGTWRVYVDQMDLVE